MDGLTLLLPTIYQTVLELLKTAGDVSIPNIEGSEWMGCGGSSPLRWGRGLGRGLCRVCPLAENFCVFEMKMVHFGEVWRPPWVLW